MTLPVDYTELNSVQRRKVREDYVLIQKNLCWFCSTSLSKPPSSSVLSRHINRKLFPIGFFKWPIHLHHDHKTGMTIGAVHSYCNAILWQYYNE